MKRICILLTELILIFCVTSCAESARPPETEAPQTDMNESADSPYKIESTTAEKDDETKRETTVKMNVQIGDKSFMATMEDNDAAREFIEMMKKAPVTLEMRDYSGFEKVGALGKTLPADDRQTTTVPGDIVLYNGNQIVMFYGSNLWSYTRLAHIDDLTGWKDSLGDGGITAVFTVEE